MGDPRGGWKVNYCRRLMKNSKSSILASDSPAHIGDLERWMVVKGYKTDQKSAKLVWTKGEAIHV